MSNQLILCSGRTRRPGWKTLDANPVHEPDFLCSIPPLPKSVTSVMWDEIEWIHGVTSFYPWDAEKILLELVRCLSGKLVLEQPDSNMIHLAKHPEWAFGDPSLGNPLHMNKWSYSPSSLAHLLGQCGFKEIEILPAQYHSPKRDFRIEARIR